jgi:formylglycine-generating enzyme required for sulfatase activity
MVLVTGDLAPGAAHGPAERGITSREQTQQRHYRSRPGWSDLPEDLSSSARHNLADFFLLETEVTNEQYERYLKSTGRDKGDTDLVAAERAREESERKSGTLSYNSHSPVYDFSNPDLLWTGNAPPKGRGNHPVGLITIADATTFCEWLTSSYPKVGLFRLPTVDEWLLAAYGGKRNYPWGDEWNFNVSCISKSEEARRTTTEPVRAHARDRTPEGIYGLWGNVAEYVTDSKDPNEPRWMGPPFKSYPMKGEGLFPFTPRNDWWGYVHNAASRQEDIGFRVLLELPGAHNKNGPANEGQLNTPAPQAKSPREVISAPLRRLATPLTQEQITELGLTLSKARPQSLAQIGALLPKGSRLFPVSYATCTTNRNGIPGLYTATTSVCRLNQTTDIVVEEDDNTSNHVGIVRSWRIRHLSGMGRP